MSSPRPHLRDRKRGEQRWKGSTRSQKLEDRAAWIIETKAAYPSLGYAELVALVRKRFECGETAAEQALARAGERLREAYKEGDPELAAEVASAYRRIAEGAEKDKKWNAARMSWDSLRSMLGLGVPDRMKIELTDGDEEAMSEMDDQEVAALAKFEDLMKSKNPTEH